MLIFKFHVHVHAFKRKRGDIYGNKNIYSELYIPNTMGKKVNNVILITI
jgi:hypothetical protein